MVVVVNSKVSLQDCYLMNDNQLYYPDLPIISSPKAENGSRVQSKNICILYTELK